MHPAVYHWVARELDRLAPAPANRIVEVGSRNVNGSVRHLFNWDDGFYVGIDLYPGPGVDLDVDAATYDPPSALDAVVCLEVLEHAEEWATIAKRMAGWLRPGGVLLLTAAADPRAPHSALDGEPLAEGREYYQNVDPDALGALLDPFLTDVTITVDREHGDVFCSGVRREG